MVLLRFADDRIKKDIEKLKKKDLKLYNQILNAFENIKEDPACGIKIPQRLIPADWSKKFGIDNLYKYNLLNGWRLFYSLIGNEVELLAIILKCLSHPEYEREFGY